MAPQHGHQNPLETGVKVSAAMKPFIDVIGTPVSKLILILLVPFF